MHRRVLALVAFVVCAWVAPARTAQAEAVTASKIRTAGTPAAQATAARIERILARSLRRGRTSIFVADAETGQRLFAYEPDDRLNPASNVKLIATATALDLLGASYRYPTQILGAVPDLEGTVTGDVYLLGSYDPTLDRGAVAELATSLVAAGVTRIAGDVVVSADGVRDNFVRSALRVTVTATSAGEAPDVEVTPASDVLVVNQATTARARRPKEPLAIEAAPFDIDGVAAIRIKVSGQIGRGRIVRRSVAVAAKAQVAARALLDALGAAGIEVAGHVRTGRFRDFVETTVARGALPLPLAEHRSAPLATIVRRVNKHSINWLADRLVISAAAIRTGAAPTMEAGVDAMYDWLARKTTLDRDDLLLDTGSGLSRATRVSARQIVTVLRTALGFGDPDPRHVARLAPIRDAYRTSLPVGGRDGTLRRRLRTVDGVVRAKTGTLRDVVALSGVLESRSGRRLVFSIITNGHRRSARARVRRAHDRIVEALCRYAETSEPAR